MLTFCLCLCSVICSLAILITHICTHIFFNSIRLICHMDSTAPFKSCICSSEWEMDTAVVSAELAAPLLAFVSCCAVVLMHCCLFLPVELKQSINPKMLQIKKKHTFLLPETLFCKCSFSLFVSLISISLSCSFFTLLFHLLLYFLVSLVAFTSYTSS